MAEKSDGLKTPADWSTSTLIPHKRCIDGVTLTAEQSTLFPLKFHTFLSLYFCGLSLGAPGWLEQLSVGLLISAQVMISRFVSSSPASGSVLMAQSLDLFPILCLPLSLPLPRSCSVSLCPKNK